MDAINSFLTRAQFLVSALREVIDARVLHEVAGEQLTQSQLQLLRLVSVKSDHSIGSLANHIGVSNPAVSKAVDRLVQRMFLRRTDREHDRRTIHLSLTTAGRKIMAKFDATKQKRIAELFSGTSEEELYAASEFMLRMSTRVVGFGSSHDQWRSSASVPGPGGNRT